MFAAGFRRADDMQVDLVPHRLWQCVSQKLLFCARRKDSDALHVAKEPTWQLRVEDTTVTRGSRRP